jgi:DNA-binding transcriptional LysR family regulator
MDNLNQLRTFMAVYRSTSISKAAERVNLTQPAVTKQIQQLEIRVQHQLFTRVPRGVIPTPAAHDFARRIEPHLDALEALAASLRIGAGSELEGTVFVGGPAEFLGAKLLPALAALTAQRINLRVRFGEPETLAADLESGAVDLAVFTVRRSSKVLNVTPLYQEELVLVGSPTWAEQLPQKALETRGDALLNVVPILAYGEELPLLRRYWRKVFGRVPSMSAALVVPDLRALVTAAVAGYGVTVLPRYLVEAAISSGQLTELLHPTQPPVNQLYLAMRSERVHPRVAFLREHLERAASDW